MKHRLTITLRDPEYSELTQVASEEERSLSWLIGQAVKEFLTRHASGRQLGLPLTDAKQMSRRTRSIASGE